MNKEKTISRNYFNRIAKEYDNNKIPEPVRCYSLLSEMLPNEIDNLLDVGCATGSMIQLLSNSRLSSSTKFVGVDLSKEMINVANNKEIKNATFLVGDVENLELDDDLFDVVICMHSFHHYPNPQKALREIYRVLKSTGRLYIVDNYKKGIRRVLKNIIIIMYFRRKLGDIKVYKVDELANMMQEEGFVNCRNQLLTSKSFLVVGEKKNNL